MRVAFVYDTVYPETKGGVERRVWEIARSLVNQGHSVDLLVPKSWDGPSVIEREGVLLRGVSQSGDLYRTSGRRTWVPSLRHAIGVHRTLKRVEFDVVDCQAPAHPAALAARLATRGRSRFKQVITWHEAWGDHWINEYGLAGRVGRVIERLVATTRARHLSVSAATAADLASIGTTGAGVVEAGIDLTAIDGIAPRHLAEVLYVGRLVPSKNVKLLLESMTELARDGIKPRLRIVGDGPDRAGLEQLVAHLGLESSVTFQGTLDRWEDVMALIKGSKVLALPSLREGFGMVALEAAACGTPVVTLDHPRNAAKDLVNDDLTGFVVASDQFTSALRRILEDDHLQSRMGIAAREGVGSGAWTDVAEATLAAYESVPA